MARLVWTLPDGEGVARWAEDEGGGGGTSTLEVIGPFPAAFDTPGITTGGVGATLTSLGPNVTVVQAWALFTEDFDPVGNFTIGFGETAYEWDLQAYPGASGYFGSPPITAPPPDSIEQVMKVGLLGAAGGVLTAHIGGATPKTAGACIVYALIHTPA